ncbi:MAG: DNA mismatch repair endonuclease MutL [Clostridia bacterium]|nr:DNA mismatch repair endonuclease MutL [Clostridia bacterium]
MGNIVLLDDLTINKIAAGEVIERPASVVKEMVENSIDAGAKNITVEIKNGGISLIRITDDGCGIAKDDMEIAFERHATSKIRKAEDLEEVRTMGFRGEALASIAAISKVEMVSKKEGEETGHRLVVEGGKTLEFTEAGRSVGTTITVQNLFFNTPVRYKFLKKDYTEAGYIEDAVTRIALVNKDVAIKLISNGKTIVQTNGNGDMKTVVYSIYGKDIATETEEIDYQYDEIRITGVVGKPVVARANRSNQQFFLNGRYIKDKNLTAAADQAYKGIIPVGRYGFLILNLEMDPKLADVNVHPAKLEVRFEDEGKVFKAVYHAIKSCLAKTELVENVEREALESGRKFNEAAEKRSNGEFVFDEEKKSGIAGLFSKIIKESEETQEELSNNHLEEIFKYRQSLEKNTVVEEKDEKTNTINDSEISKKVEFGNALISSETKELDVSVVNDMIKDATTEMISTKLANKEMTQVIDTEAVRTVEDSNMEETQKINLNESKSVSQETVVAANADLNNLPEHTMIIDTTSNINKEDEEKNETTNEVVLSEDENDFSKIAAGLFAAKLDIDSTQSIDTAKVREALKEEKEFEANPEFDAMYKKTFGVDPFAVRQEKEQEKLEQEKLNVAKDFEYPNENMNVFEDEANEVKVPYKFLGIAFNTYIIIELKNEMYIIDQHAAHERILYEKVKENYYSGENRDEQFLLLPDVITLSHKEMIIARENVEMFSRAGFSFEEFGDNTIKLMSVPGMCEDLNTKQLFLDILDEIDTVAVTAKQEKEDKFIATVACKAAVKAKMKLDEKEVDSLMQVLLELPNPFTCPHGRPTAIKMTKYDLERKFSRR